MIVSLPFKISSWIKGNWSFHSLIVSCHFRLGVPRPFELLVLSLALVSSQRLSAEILPYKLAPKVSNKEYQRIHLFIVLFSLNLFSELINKPDFSRDLTIFIISFIFSFSFINVIFGGACLVYCLVTIQAEK